MLVLNVYMYAIYIYMYMCLLYLYIYICMLYMCMYFSAGTISVIDTEGEQIHVILEDGDQANSDCETETK